MTSDLIPASASADRPSRRGTLAMVRDLFRLRVDKSASRIGLVGLGFAALFSLIAGRLVWLIVFPDQPSARHAASKAVAAVRPDIVDRNGEVMATDVKTVSVFAEPKNIIDKDEAVELLTAVLPDLDARELRDKLAVRSKGFIWVKREITPRQQAEVHRLGIPGVGFLSEHKRVYPNGNAAAHVLGFANIDNVGIAGMEKYIDSRGLQDLAGAGFKVNQADLKPVQLSIDLRAQHALRDELAKGMAKYKAKAAAGAILDVNTGEVVSLVSLPDFDPNNPVDALEKDRINRINVGVFEMGSTFKALTVAMALDSGKFSINSSFDARSALRYGRFTINDYRGQHRVLTAPEVFIYSSNIGTAKMALGIGVEGHKAFLRKMGQLERLQTELPENAAPILPPRWGELNTITIAFGHGLAVAPLQALMAVGSLVNGGTLIPPTFIKRTEAEAMALGRRVIKPETSEAMRYVLRLNASHPSGSASKAAIAGFYVGGKTGTAEKVVNGRYSKNKNLTTFTAVAPMDKPRYLFLTVMDEPQAVEGTYGFSTAGWNAAPITGNVIERVAPILGIPPKFEPPQNPFPLMTRLGAWGSR